MILGVSGHRKIGDSYGNNPTKDKVRKDFEDILKELKPEKCITGMAIGFDTMVAESCIKLNMPFIAAVPFAGQEKMWPQHVQMYYHDLLKKAERIVTVSEGGFSNLKMQIRNEWIVDNCDLLIACFNGDPSGGTYNCIKYAKNNNKEIKIINPNA